MSDYIIRRAVLDAQAALARHIEPGGLSAEATILKLLRVLDDRKLVIAMRDAA